MAYDILKEIPEPINIPSTVPGWMEAAAKVLGNAQNERKRQTFGLEKVVGGIRSTDDKLAFPAVLWERQYGRSLKYFGLVDKRRIHGGIMLTAFADAPQRMHTAVQAFVVNDEHVPYRGLRRILNTDFAGSVAATTLDALHASMTLEEVNQRPNEVQLKAFSKIISTAVTPV